VATILLCWVIWTARNGLIFNGIQANVQNCGRSLLQELKLVQLRVKQCLQSSFELWIVSLNLDPPL
jgi:hypothetical protein